MVFPAILAIAFELAALEILARVLATDLRDWLAQTAAPRDHVRVGGKLALAQIIHSSATSGANEIPSP